MTTELKIIETEWFIATLRADGLAHIHLKANTLITVEVQSEMEKAYWGLTDVHRPFLFTGDEFVAITKEARANAIAMEIRVPISVTAIVVKNLAQKIIADYYYKFNRPKNPYRVFKDFEKAVAWLHENHEIPQC